MRRSKMAGVTIVGMLALTSLGLTGCGSESGSKGSSGSGSPIGTAEKPWGLNLGTVTCHPDKNTADVQLYNSSNQDIKGFELWVNGKKFGEPGSVAAAKHVGEGTNPERFYVYKGVPVVAGAVGTTVEVKGDVVKRTLDKSERKFTITRSGSDGCARHVPDFPN